MDKLEKFIIFDSFNNLKNIGYADTRTSILQNYENYFNNRIINFFLKLNKKNTIEKIINRRKNCSLLFHTKRYSHLINSCQKIHDISVIAGISELLFSFNNKTGYLSDIEIKKELFNYFISENVEYLYSAIEITRKKLQLINPNFLILASDALPLDRILIATCRELGIKTIYVQDGVFQSRYPPIQGRVADYVFVWGDFFRELYLNNNIRNEKSIFVIGYPYYYCRDWQEKPNTFNIYYLGQNFEHYNNSILQYKIDTIEKINKLCKELNQHFFYKPHPNDDFRLLRNKLPNIKFTKSKEKLLNVFNKGHIFISFNSTSLIEAAINSKISIQLINYPIKTDNFESIGVVHKSFNNIDDLCEILKNIIKNYENYMDFKFNNYYIDITKYSENEFLKYIKII